MKIIFSYTKDDTIVVRRCLCASGDIVLPGFIAGRPVTELSPYVFSESELGIYENAFIFDSDDGGIYECTSEAEEQIDKSEEVICERLTSLSLPRTLLKAGRYGFYNCSRLHSLKMYSTTIDLGFGMFTGCSGVRQLDMTVSEDRRSSLNDVLVNIRYPLKLIYRTEKSATDDSGRHLSPSAGPLCQSSGPRSEFADLSGDLLPECTNIGIGSERRELRERAGTEADAPIKYRLIFPEYYENSKENTPARITVRDMQGSGYMYRNCFADTMFQIKRYDALFPYAEALESEETVCELALCRLETPTDLSEEAREKYTAYLKLHIRKLTELMARHLEDGETDTDTFRRIASADFISDSASSVMLDTASVLKKPDILALLMDIRHERFPSAGSAAQPGLSDSGQRPRKRRFSL